MSEQLQSNDQPPLAANTTQLTCEKCRHQFTVQQPLNLPTNEIQVSILVIPHLEPDLCPNCGAAYMPQIVAWQVQLGYVMVPVEALPSKIVKARMGLVM